MRIMMGGRDDNRRPNILTLPLLPLFRGSVNLEEFDWELDFPMNFGTEWAGSLGDFAFPNLTTFKLTASPTDGLYTSDLFDFLKTSPTLRTVEVRINGRILPNSIPRDTLVLPNVETFSLRSMDSTWNVYESAIHVSCPRAKYTSLINEIPHDQFTFDPDTDTIFPDSVSWSSIVRQYTASPVEEVTFEINRIQSEFVNVFSLTFRSPDATVIELGFEFPNSGQDGMNLEIFTRACRTIQDHPKVSHVRRLHIKDRSGILDGSNALAMAGLVEALFRSLGPLDELTVHGCDLQIFFAPHIYLWEFRSAGRQFPPVQELTILEPLVFDEQQDMDGLEELARLQHELNQPLERVTVRARVIPTTLAERLRQWVGTVECYEL